MSLRHEGFFLEGCFFGRFQLALLHGMTLREPPKKKKVPGQSLMVELLMHRPSPTTRKNHPHQRCWNEAKAKEFPRGQSQGKLWKPAAPRKPRCGGRCVSLRRGLSLSPAEGIGRERLTNPACSTNLCCYVF
jgi:hypothetical protein